MFLSVPRRCIGLEQMAIESRGIRLSQVYNWNWKDGHQTGVHGRNLQSVKLAGEGILRSAVDS